MLLNFTNIDICHFVNTAFFTIKKSWTEFMQAGEWTLGARGTKKDRAGGSSENVTFLFNPQVSLSIMFSDFIVYVWVYICPRKCIISVLQHPSFM